ncbi:MAG TPA: methionine adenosyltransferase [Planctomycetaceae bacterium]|nr:methionine adenosyltransferase [Planctomycetaceae bacterium]
MMQAITIQPQPARGAIQRRVEYVERKGIGHPDTICDCVMEATSIALCRAYREACGRVLHHNVDKGLLVAGQSSPRPGGGRIDAPMRLIFSDRATTEVGGKRVPVGEIAESAAKDWLRRHLRFVDPDRHVVYQNEIRPGSPELVDLFARQELTANDTSAAVGYAPLTETERLVLEAERFLNSPQFKQRRPEVGEDIKVMGVRQDRHLSLTVAAAIVDRFCATQRVYFDFKEAVRQELYSHLEGKHGSFDSLDVAINTLDDPARGDSGMYLTVLGTSAEGADGGEVGRGNRVNGLISFHRPMTTEAAAGKNPVAHVGKIYNLLSHQIAQRIHAEVDGILEVTVWICSQIGSLLGKPLSIAIEPLVAGGAIDAGSESKIRTIVENELTCLPAFVERLIRGELPVC